MGIQSDYPQPIQVNGYICHNCTDVELAKKSIDPAHPRSGPLGFDANSGPTRINRPEVGLAAKQLAKAFTQLGVGDRVDIQV